MRFFLPIPLLLALLCAGCSTPMERFKKKQAKQDRAAKDENSRTVETQRMNVLSGSGASGTKRWAEIAVIDPDKTYDPTRSSVGGHTYDTGKARVKDFYYDQKAHPGSYGTRDFYGSKKNWAGDMKFAARDANTHGKYAIPNADKTASSKAAPIKEAWDAGKTAATRGLHDGQREYRGPERAKLGQSIDPMTMADWRHGAQESVVNSGTSVEKYSTMKQLSIEDIRELLNKNK